MKVKMDEISPEKLAQIDQEMLELRIQDLTLASLKEIAAERKATIDKMSKVELQCKVRIMKAMSFGSFTKKEMADIFEVTTQQITKWIGK